MKAVVTDGKGSAEWKDIEAVHPNEYQCLCKINACATCSGTDQKLVKGLFAWADRYPAILGHESVGTILECGSKVKNFKVNQRVLRPAVALPGTMHGSLASWMGGFAEYGLITDFAAMESVPRDADPCGYARYQQVIPENCEISNADATMLIMLKEVSGACRGAKISRGQSVLVLGAGAVAQAMCFFGAAAGAKILVAARRAEPLERCISCGAHIAIDLSKEELEQAVLRETQNRGPDRVMDAAGNVDLAIRAANLLADGGGIASYATVEGGVFPKDKIHPKGSWEMLQNAIPENEMHQEIMKLAAEKKLNPEKFYSHKMKFSDFEQGFPLLGAKKASKIVFEMN